MNALLPASIFPLPESSNRSRSQPERLSNRERYFALITTVEETGGQPYTMQVAQDRSGDEQFVKKFGALLAVVLALGTLASAAIGMAPLRNGGCGRCGKWRAP